MEHIDDIEEYIVRLQLMGSFPIMIQKVNSNKIIKVVEVLNDIKYNATIYDVMIEYRAKKGDYLIISDLTNIVPLKQNDFNTNYKKFTIKRKIETWEDKQVC